MTLKEFKADNGIEISKKIIPNLSNVIEAAPDLLEQLKLAMHEIQRSDRWHNGNNVTARLVDSMRDAILKAEGK